MAPETPDLEVRVAYVGDTATVTVVGEIDLSSSTRLNRELDAVVERVPPPTIVRIDLAAVGYMDTTGVAVLLKGRRRAHEVGARFAVISTSQAIARLFEITGLAGLLAET